MLRSINLVTIWHDKLIRDWCAKWTLCGWSNMPLFSPGCCLFLIYFVLFDHIPLIFLQDFCFRYIWSNQCHLITVVTQKYFSLILTCEGKCLMGWWDDNLCLSISYGCEHCLVMLLRTTRSDYCYSLYLLFVWSCMEGTKFWNSFSSKHR